jgi:peptidoglycan/xylan/chitin deacetylase (PgdA/CDA1 family)
MTALLFHSIDIKPRLNLSSFPSDKFSALLDCLKRNNIETVTVSRHTHRHTHSDTHYTHDDTHQHTQRSPALSTAITFDDGLLSFYENAYPLLEEKNIKATVFPVAGLLGKTGRWDVMGRTRHAAAPMLREIAAAGHEIGSHSLTHANLVWLDNRELRKELRDSKDILEDITGAPIKSLSFPFGSWNVRVWDAAKAAGYEYATAYRGHRRAPPEMLPAFGVYRFDSVEDIVNRVSPAPSMSKILARIMSHFSKGTPLVKFRKEYVEFPEL